MAETWKEFAFKAEVATLSDTDPSAVSTTAAAGSGEAASRDDHVHVLGAGCIDSNTLFAASVVDQAAIKHAVVDAQHIGDLNGAWAFNGYQATNLIVYQSSNQPATPVVGKIYQDIEDGKTYICTSSA